jgi:hypothetical protein
MKLAAEAGLPARPVSVSIEHITDANDLFSVRAGTSGQDDGGMDCGKRQLNAMHSAWDFNRRLNFFISKLNLARKHNGRSEVENLAPDARHQGVGITRIDVSETYLNWLGVGHITCERQAIDGNFWPIGRDEFSVAKFGGFFGSGDGAHQLNALPTKYDKLEKGDDGKSAGSPKKQFSETREPPIVLCLFVLAAVIGGGLILTLFGWQNLYNDRRLFGASLVGLGCLIGLSGLGWWWSWLL